MSAADSPDLFTAAGLVLDAEPAPPKPKRPRKPAPPSPAARAAVVRLEGARRSQGPAKRAPTPIAETTAQVHAFPPCRNTRLVAALLKRFQALLEQHDREGAKVIFERTYLAPMRAKLSQLGLAPASIENEVYALKAAVRDLGWHHQAEQAGRIGA